MIASPFDPIETIRQQTRPSHDRLEDKGVFSAIMHPEVALADVIALFRVLHRFYAAHERTLLDGLAGSPAVGLYRRRLPLIEADLHALGGEAPAPSGRRLVLADAYAQLGALYAIEGSSLGGMVIAKHLERHLPAGIAGNIAYFSRLGQDAKAHWLAVLATLRAALPDAAAAQSAAAGASAVFDEMHALAFEG